MSHSFLVELGTEELPPTSLKDLSDAFSNYITTALNKKGLAFDTATAYATPRRLALSLTGLAESTPEVENKVWGPPAKIAFDKEGKPSKAAEAFAKKNGIAVSALETANDGKQDKLFCLSKSGGESTSALLGDIVREALSSLPIKKRMRWGASRVEFVRPVQWLVLLLDDKVLEEDILGVSASNTTRGHRFHANRTFAIESIADYAELLEKDAKVIADFDRRKTMIKSQVEALAASINGTAVIEEDLLDEVTALVEWPVALAGKFDESFLSIPAEALVSSMTEHQKYFHLVDDKQQLLAKFITVSNIESHDPAQVIDGNERVIRPRLADAAFFFETDKKSSLEARREKLKTVTFQAQLGSVYEKTERIKRLSGFIAKALNADVTLAERAAELCKSDLVSAMVYEFPDMQGIAGSHYARNDGEQDEVAQAMTEQYMPKFAGDDVPASTTGAIIALADRIDTVTGIFGIGQKPTGSKDPFALRRSSLGILRILVDKSFALDLQSLVSFAAEGFTSLPESKTVVDDVVSYCLERFRSWYQEAKLTAEIFQSVHAKQLTVPVDIDQRVHAVEAFTQLSEAPSLAEANKRVSNILNKHEGTIPQDVNTALLSEASEKALADALEKALIAVRPLLENQDYEKALCSLASLKQPVGDFFDNVMVMCDDTALRDNRLALLNTLRSVFLEVADISLLVVKN
ncbi:MAG: glycine--tRNA ligase subunit beta [Agarilytica sp.]